MAKKSLILKNINIYKNSLLYVNVIKQIKKKINILKNLFKLSKIKKKNFFIKFNNRCYISGRRRSYYNKFSLNRNFIRKIGYIGNIVGLEKSSW
ncbi:30S ribosomal protein S14 [Candidatus Carsonella ruddii]|uniref:Ribosomal protein S14 n=1 Tax=Candidatus Carsonella ruddii HC isolate Thao2000 TaxID=1202538 RepID=J3TEB9_CARRU|nr:30S ribosomal protein S14 [Candidatus Carsonella ruddii]AFP84012.1 ribosomal protein S14 [Candidatus Carsonella ruddii HC isolate Thao2000]